MQDWGATITFLGGEGAGPWIIYGQRLGSPPPPPKGSWAWGPALPSVELWMVMWSCEPGS